MSEDHASPEDRASVPLQALLQDGLSHHRAGRLEVAKEHYEKVLEEDSSRGDALYLLGVLLAQTGNLENALAFFDRAITFGLDDQALHSNRAKVCNSLGRLQDALQSFARLIEIAPDSLDAQMGEAECQLRLGHYEAAMASYQKALALSPESLLALSAMANVYYQSGDLLTSLDFLTKSLELAPKDPALHSSRALILLELGRMDEAQLASQESIELDPSNAQNHFVRGRILERVGQIDEALASFDQSLALDPGSPANEDKTVLLYGQGLVDQAMEAAQVALMVKPTANRWSAFLMCLSHYNDVDDETLFSLYLKFAEHFEAPYRAQWPQHTNQRVPDRRLKIGFVSGDFCNHVVTTLVLPIIQHINSDLFEVWAYSNNHQEDFVTEVLKEVVDHWQRVDTLDDEAFSNLILGDGIDILVDLSGHTAKNRLPVFARKPAPIQVTWIGDPVTTGLTAMDYVITDFQLSPKGLDERHWTEKFIRIPAAATLDLTGSEEYTRDDLPAFSDGYVTFGSFNRAPKINTDVMRAWAAILQAVPDSRLMIGGTPKDHQSRTLSELKQLGISKDRLIFKGRTSKGEYLKLHAGIDILLDTWPFSGGGTTAYGLAFGAVPIVTLGGHSMRHSQGAWLMRHLGLEDWIADSEARYIEIAVEKASNLDKLAHLRRGLPNLWRESSLGDPIAVTHGIEAAFRAVWQRYCEGMAPETMDIDLSASPGASA